MLLTDPTAILHGPQSRGICCFRPSKQHSPYAPRHLDSVSLIDRCADVSEKGIAGRAVFIDWYSWALNEGIQIDGMTSHEIPFDQIIKTLEYQNMSLDSLRAGDIIVIRFGYLAQYENMDATKREYLNELYKTQKPDNMGLKPSKELLKFLWNTKIAAICGDSRSLDVGFMTVNPRNCHQHALLNHNRIRRAPTLVSIYPGQSAPISTFVFVSNWRWTRTTLVLHPG